MNRGEIWTVSGGGEYTNKPRPCLIVQNGDLTIEDFVIVAVLTSKITAPSPNRFLLHPTEQNGLQTQSLVMVDRLKSVKLQNFGQRIGSLDSDSMFMIERMLKLLLGLNR
ncbi:MAG: type II toxin-antitoxin system PemK/MazF family toxin [Candidatus Pacebacteria bacterium]|nr:type II toxin-antitoxin system PemK/MazF family toxin [Candidatus Paceibacterota bacterium]